VGLIDTFIQNAKLKLKTRTTRTTDTILGIFNALSAFADYIELPMSSKIDTIAEDDIPKSSVYNDTLKKIMMDGNAIRDHQKSILKGLLVSWNSSEQVSSSALTNVSNDILPIDESFSVATLPAKVGDSLTLAIKSFSSGISILKTAPSLKATSTDRSVVPVYGKSYGLYTPGNESGEDAIRTNKNDGSLIVDKKDTFWEVEAVTLQASMDDAFTPQVVNTTELSLVVNLTLAFTSPINLNSFSIIPHSFAQSAYFDITDIVILTGGTSTPVITTPITCFSDTRITFPTIKANGINISLRQNKGYFIKYSLAKYRLKNNEAWIDFTGPELIKRVDTSSDDINKAISDQIVSAGKWLPGIWIPNSPSKQPATLIVSEGTDGYRQIESVASHRKRWAIGIQDIDFGQETYESVSEAVTTPYTMPDETTSIYLTVNDDTPKGTKITYQLSFDDGSSWIVINPINKVTQQLTSGYIVPQKIYVNSDLSLSRKQNTLTGINGYVNSAARAVRIRAILEKDDTTINTPRVKKLTPVFDTSVPTL
jgi:hypothetical protein